MVDTGRADWRRLDGGTSGVHAVSKNVQRERSRGPSAATDSSSFEPVHPPMPQSP